MVDQDPKVQWVEIREKSNTQVNIIDMQARQTWQKSGELRRLRKVAKIWQGWGKGGRWRGKNLLSYFVHNKKVHFVKFLRKAIKKRPSFNPIRSGLFQTVNDPGGGL